MTTSRRAAAAAVAGALLSLSGCSCSNDPAGSGDGGQVSLEGLRKVFGELCGVVARCPDLSGYPSPTAT
jgi:hypothetical protein